MRSPWPLRPILAAATVALLTHAADEPQPPAAPAAPAAQTQTATTPAATPEEPQQLDTMVISATRTETPMSQLGQSVTVISREQIQDTQFTNVTDLLREVAGVDFRTNGPHSSSTTLALRGLAGYHTKVMVNGIALQDPASVQQMPILNDINLEDVERIEIVRGPSSTVYGSNALGGVVNIITRKGADTAKPTGNLGVEVGSHGRLRTAGSARGQSGIVDYSVSVLRESEDGISAQDTPLNRDNDAWRNEQVQGTVGLRLAENVRLEFFGRYSTSDEEYDMADAVWGPFKDTGEIHNQRWMSGLRLEATDLLDGLLDTSLSASASDLRRGYGDDDGWSLNDGFSGRTTEYTWQNTLHLHERVDLTLGLDHVTESAEVQDGGSPSWGISPSTPVDASHRTGAAFAEAKIEPIDNLFLNGGVRYNDHSVFGHEWTWTSAAAYHVAATGTRLKTSAGKSYRAPSLYELYEPQYGNPDLGPEVGNSWDMGFEQDLCAERITFGSTYFRNRVSDYIGFDMVSWTYDQISGIKTNGLESFVRYRPMSDLSLQLTHTYQHSNNMEEDASPLAFTPSQKGSADVTWRPLGGKVTLNLNGSYTGDRATTAGGDETLHDYILANAAVTYRVTKTLEVYGRVQNLLNENYEVAPNYNEYGRVYYVGMNVSF